MSTELTSGAARPPDRLVVGASGLTRAPPQRLFHEPAELIDEIDIAFVDRLERDLFERILPVDSLRRLALRGQLQAKLRDEFFQTVFFFFCLAALRILSYFPTRSAIRKLHE